MVEAMGDAGWEAERAALAEMNLGVISRTAGDERGNQRRR